MYLYFSNTMYRGSLYAKNQQDPFIRFDKTLNCD